MKTFVLLLLSLAWAFVTPSLPISPFPTELFLHIVKNATSENIIFSPVSIQTCLVMAYLGAENETAQELQIGLQFKTSDKLEAAKLFTKLVDKTKSSDKASLKIANAIYINSKYHLSNSYYALFRKHFGANALVSRLIFADSLRATAIINAWIEKQTENKTKNLIHPDILNDSTGVVLVNVVNFKAKWVNIFNSYYTDTADFSVNASRKVPVSMMYQEDSFLFGDLADLDALALQMAYIGTDISMLVLLPKRVDGLAALEQKLKGVDLTELSSQMRKKKVRVLLPKFKIEFDISLKPVLKEMGMGRMFSSEANFDSLLSRPATLAISEVMHKAFIEVDEAGTEAAAATYGKIIATSGNVHEVIYNFEADHPFFFALIDNENVYFAGHVVNF